MAKVNTKAGISSQVTNNTLSQPASIKWTFNRIVIYGFINREVGKLPDMTVHRFFLSEMSTFFGRIEF